MKHVIKMQGVKKSFTQGRDYVLNNLNLNIRQGEITFIIGYSGTGKSVLLRHMLALLQPSEGRVEVLGQDLWQLSEAELVKMRCQFGVLFQNAALFDDISVIENVLFPLNEHRRHLSKTGRLRIAEQHLNQLGIENKHFDKLPGVLSGGQRKRVGLARALVLNPRIFIYDEPTTGLDPILANMVDNLIADTHKRTPGLTSIVVSHDIHTSFRLADHVVMLDEGRVLLEGKPDDFFKSKIKLVQQFLEKGIVHSVDHA